MESRKIKSFLKEITLDSEIPSYFWMHSYDELYFKKVVEENYKTEIKTKLESDSFIECRVFNKDCEYRLSAGQPENWIESKLENLETPYLKKIQIVECIYENKKKDVQLNVIDLLKADDDGQYYVADRYMMGVTELG